VYAGADTLNRPKNRKSLSCMGITVWHEAGNTDRHPQAGALSMHARYLLLAAASLVLLPAAASGQRVVADISITEGPVSGHVIIGDRYGQRPRYRDSDVRAVSVYRSARGHSWYHRHGYRIVRVWYDAERHRYYDRCARNYRGLREVVVYERGGRYYQDDDRYDRDDRDNDDRHWDRDRD
jgi:hypothetical protein